MREADENLPSLHWRLRDLQKDLRRVNRLIKDKSLTLGLNHPEVQALIRDRRPLRASVTGVQEIYRRAGGPKWNQKRTTDRYDAWLARQSAMDNVPAAT